MSATPSDAQCVVDTCDKVHNVDFSATRQNPHGAAASIPDKEPKGNMTHHQHLRATADLDRGQMDKQARDDKADDAAKDSDKPAGYFASAIAAAKSVTDKIGVTSKSSEAPSTAGAQPAEGEWQTPANPIKSHGIDESRGNYVDADKKDFKQTPVQLGGDSENAFAALGSENDKEESALEGDKDASKPGLVDRSKQGISDLTHTVTDALGTAKSSLTGAASNATSSVTGAVSTATSSVTGALSGLKDKIMGSHADKEEQRPEAASKREV